MPPLTLERKSTCSGCVHDRIVFKTYVLSLATIMQDTPWTVPTPVMIPPAGISSPGYSCCPAKDDSSRKDVPESMSVVIRLHRSPVSARIPLMQQHTLAVASCLSLCVFLLRAEARLVQLPHDVHAYSP